MEPKHEERETVEATDDDVNIEAIKGRICEWESVHAYTKHEDLRPFFTYRRTIYQDGTEEIQVVCQDCGHEEVVGVGERNGDTLEWSVLRQEGNELN